MTFFTQLQSDLAGIFSTDEIGETVTVTPVSGAAFTCTAVFGQVELDKIINRNIVGDSAECRIRHADILAASQTEPVTKAEHRSGWVVSRLDLNGTAQSWDVIDKGWSKDGCWILLLERNLRIVP